MEVGEQSYGWKYTADFWKWLCLFLSTALSVSATLYMLTRAYLVNITQESTDKLGVQYPEKDKTYPDVK